MSYRFNPPPGWDVAEGFNPEPGWAPDPSWPAAPDGWEFWLPDAVVPPPPPGPPQSPGATSTAQSAAQSASAKVGGMFRSLKSKAQDEDWMGKAKAAASQATTAAKDAGAQVSAKAKERDQATLDKLGPLPEGALWRGVSHESGRNAVVTLFPDRIERYKASSRTSLTGMLTGGPEDVEVIPTKSVSSVQVSRGPWYHDVTIYASGNTIVLSVAAHDAEELRSLITSQILGGSSASAGGAATPAAPAAPPAPPAPAAPSGDDILEQIRKLGELRDAGILTQEEFDSKKADLLARM